MSKSVKGVIVNYGKGPRTQRSKYCLLKFPSIESVGEASQLIGRKVTWSAGKAKCVGKIVALHEKNGLVRARFRRGVPGEAMGTFVEISG